MVLLLAQLRAGMLGELQLFRNNLTVVSLVESHAVPDVIRTAARFSVFPCILTGWPHDPGCQSLCFRMHFKQLIAA